MTTRYQNSSCRLVFHQHESYPGGTRRTKVVESSRQDVISCTVQKSLGQAAGGFQFNLAPRQEYLRALRSNDWVEIYLDGMSPPSATPLMVGSIDTVSRRRVTDGKGVTKEVISVSGRDYGKVLLNIALIVDPLLGALIDQTLFEAQILLRKTTFAERGNPFVSPGEAVANLLKAYHEGRVQCLAPGSLLLGMPERAAPLIRSHPTMAGVGPGLLANIHPTRGRLCVTGNPNLSGNLWSTLQFYSNSVLNEMWVDTIDGHPVLTLEERPFTHEAFTKLHAVEVDATEVNQEDLRLSDSDTQNWIRVFPEAAWLNHESVAVLNVGYTNPKSVNRSGFRKLEPVTNAFADFSQPIVDSKMGVPSGLLEEYTALLTEWYGQNDELFDGTMSMRLRRDVRVGTRLDYSNRRSGERLSFYVEGVTHSFAYPGGASTSVNLTRGVERASDSVSFPLLRSLANLKSGKVVARLSEPKPFQTIEPQRNSILQSPLELNLPEGA
jgi:hypothetical protein